MEKIKDFFASWDSSNGWNANAKVQALSLQSVDKLPGISSLNMDVVLKQDILSLDIKDQVFKFDSAGLFPEVFLVQRLSTRLNIYKDNTDWIVTAPSLFLDTKDIKTHSYFEIRFAKGKKPFLTLNTIAENGDIAKIIRYVPTCVKPAILAWFEQAFISGRVIDINTYIKGYMNELVSENSDAVFRIDATVSDATFSYAKGWPIVEKLDATFHMDGVRMEIEAQAAEVFGVQPRLVKAVIPHYRETSLELYIDAPHSPMRGLLRYVTESPLNKLVGGVGNLFEGEGYSDVSLRLKKNISKVHYSDLKAYFDGVIRLQKTALNIPSLDMQLDQLSGNVNFSNKHIASKQLIGKINRQDFTGKVKTNTTDLGPRSVLTINTRLSLQDLIKTKVPILTNKITGRSVWQASIEIPLNTKQKPANLSVKSDLKGTAINFPAPLNKDVGQPAEMNVFIVLNKTTSNRIWLNYKKLLQSVLVFNRESGELYSGRINYQRGKPVLPRGPGVSMDVSIEHVDIDPWIDFAFSQGKSAIRENVLQRINFQSDLLNYKSVGFKQVKGIFQQHAKHWSIDVKGEGLAGEILLAKNKKLPLDVKLNTLNLNKLVFPKGVQQVHSEPRDIPGTQLVIDQLIWNDIKLSNLSAEIKSVETGLKIESYQVNDSDLNISGKGLWESSTEGLQRSFMKFKARTLDINLGLQKIGVNNFVKGGTGEFNGMMSWKKPLYQLDFPSLSGTIRGEVSKGDLLVMKPGIIKLFGVLNIESLPKRLALDFKDLSSKGLAFDKANFSIDLEQGIATFKHMKIDTDFGEINIEGRTDLVKQELDQIIKVNPGVSNILSITAGAIGGLPSLVGALLVDKVIKALGGDADRVAQVRFKINGKWDDPKVILTRVDRVKDLSKDEMRQRAKELTIKELYRSDAAGGVTVSD